ncbi:MAG: hypothetical protein QOF74_6109 [Caballeronia mineralivorans]|jgi:hypothetical protein|nr:hypothetical protein [Caballeronia mineralivorans]
MNPCRICRSPPLHANCPAKSAADSAVQPPAARKPLTRLVTLAVATSLAAALLMTGCNLMAHDLHVDGIAWQPDDATANPSGNWDVLGAQDLLIQWIAVDDTAFIPNAGLMPVPHLPDLARIGREPWAKNVILGLAGYQDEKRARANVAKLVEQSLMISRVPVPLHVVGYYFPVEVDPSWTDAPKLAASLQDLPRPLWITVYDQSNIGGKPLTDWLATWLPADVGIFFQDGVGVYAREPEVARTYLDALVERFGKDRVRVIAEAFRPTGRSTFRSATPEEMRPQLQAYRGYSVYLFDGPHYVSETLIKGLAPDAAAKKASKG